MTTDSEIDTVISDNKDVANFTQDTSSSVFESKHKIYAPPKSDRLFDIKQARVSPVSLLVSFKRQPQKSRYKKVTGVNGAKLMNYFTHKLKFTLERADLNFAGYRAFNVKGPPDRLIEMIKAVYISRLKNQALSLLTSVSIQDWKHLSARQDGDDEYVEGDVLRMTGNMAGRSTNFIFKKVGKELGTGLQQLTGTIGDGIEDVTELIGVGMIGSGVNNVVSGLGDGVSNTVQGVGKGAGKVFKGAGMGVGQIAGGITGGVNKVGKGIGKGVVDGDVMEVLTGFADGAAMIGSGVGQGMESVVLGVGDGVLSMGKGFFSGFKSVGMGVGDALTGEKKERKGTPQKGNSRRRKSRMSKK
mmetsp:Transcript_58755/g.68646  ORF Transcript_58755/g.68646 Transcript_58755/m.68646 type:complete len:357 (+) Transcript_58755:241-1311(+)